MSKRKQANGGLAKGLCTGLLIAGHLGFAGQAVAVSAVAFDVNNSYYGYVYNVSDEGEARARALHDCTRRAGVPCRVVLVCASGGYGAIASYRREGLDRTAWGAVCGQESERKAQDLAIKACNRDAQGRCGNPQTAWFDEFGK